MKQVLAEALTNEHYVEAIIDDKLDENGQQLFKVRWFGFNSEHDTWEPRTSFNDSAIIDNYLSERDTSQKNGSDVAK